MMQEQRVEEEKEMMQFGEEKKKKCKWRGRNDGKIKRELETGRKLKINSRG